MAKSKNAAKGSVAQVQDKDERRKALDAAMAQIEKQFGQGAVMRLGDKSQVEIDTIPTGALTLDIALGIGGLPRGRIIEIYGPESSGKTTLALHIVAEAQKQGGKAAFIDAEHALDPEHAAKLGVDIGQGLPDTADEAPHEEGAGTVLCNGGSWRAGVGVLFVGFFGHVHGGSLPFFGDSVPRSGGDYVMRNAELNEKNST